MAPWTLVIEDDEMIRETVAEVLETEGYAVSTAANGQDAVQLLIAKSPPSLILLDLKLPVMNGWAFRRWQQEQPALARVPVVLMSATSMVSLSAEWLGAAGYLRKPISRDRLLEVVQKLGSQTKSPEAHPG